MKNNFPKTVPISGRVRVCVELVNSINLKNKVVLDVGSSFGWLEKEILKKKPKKIVGVEINEEALAFAKKNIKGVEFLVGSALELPIAKNSVDVLTLFDVLEHVPEGTEMRVLSEVRRVLKKRGILLLSTPNNHVISKVFDLAWYFGHRHYDKDKLSKMLKRSGFKVQKIESRGSFLSSLYLCWFYIQKRITGSTQPRNTFLEKLDDIGYDNGFITDIFLIAIKL